MPKTLVRGSLQAVKPKWVSAFSWYVPKPGVFGMVGRESEVNSAGLLPQAVPFSVSWFLAHVGKHDAYPRCFRRPVDLWLADGLPGWTLSTWSASSAIAHYAAG